MEKAQGYVLIKGGDFKKWKKKWIVIESQTIVIYPKQGPLPEKSIPNLIQCTYKRIKKEEAAKEKEKENCILLHTPLHVDYYLSFETSNDLESWLKILKLVGVKRYKDVDSPSKSSKKEKKEKKEKEREKGRTRASTLMSHQDLKGSQPPTQVIRDEKKHKRSSLFMSSPWASDEQNQVVNLAGLGNDPLKRTKSVRRLQKFVPAPETTTSPQEVQETAKSTTTNKDSPAIEETRPRSHSLPVSPDELERRRKRKEFVLSQLGLTAAVQGSESPDKSATNESPVKSKSAIHHTVRISKAKQRPNKDEFLKSMKRRGGSLTDIFAKLDDSNSTANIENDLSIRWEDFMQSVRPAKEKKRSAVYFVEMAKENQVILSHGETIIGAMLKNKEKKEEEEKESVEAAAPPPPPLPPIIPPKPEKINILGNNDEQYAAMFGECNTPGLHIWIVVDQKPADVPKREYGVFYTKDCYIVLHIEEENDEISQKGMHVHIWIGAESTTDKRAYAAIRTVELNKYLGDKGIHHREEENEETDLFLSYFPYGIGILEGGTENKFRNYADTPIAPNRAVEFKIPRLYSIVWRAKEKNLVLLTRVTPVNTSLDNSNVFLLDMGNVIYVWRAPKADNVLTFMTLGIANNININFRNGKAKVRDLTRGVVDEVEAFWNLLGGSLDEFPDPTDNFKNPLFIEGFKASNILDYKVANQTNTDDCDQLDDIKKAWLKPDHCYVINCRTEVFIWIGNKSSNTERKLARQCAESILKNESLPEWVIIQEEHCGNETVFFKSKFSDWPEKLTNVPLAKTSAITASVNYGKLAAEKKREVDIPLLFTDPPQSMSPGYEGTDITQEGIENGNAELWILDKIVGPGFSKIPEQERGIFFSEEAYMLLYTYYDNSDSQKYMAYFWQGQDASHKWWASWSAGFFPTLEKKVQSTSGELPLKVRNLQWHEAPYFLKLFNSSLVVRKGKRKDLAKKSFPRLFHIRYHATRNVTRAIEVAPDLSLLNSKDSFLVETASSLYLWHGSLCDSTLIEKYKSITTHFEGKEVLEIEEGKEPDGFWSVFGGQKKTFLDQSFHATYKEAPKLFRCSTKSGDFTVEEIREYTQADLKQDEIFFLDTQFEIYAWIGPNSGQSERNMSQKATEEYAKYASSLRNRPIPIVNLSDFVVEPVEFTRHFHAWNYKENDLDPRQRTYLRFLERQKQEEQQKALEEQLKASKEEQKPSSVITITEEISPRWKELEIQQLNIIEKLHALAARLGIEKEVTPDDTKQPETNTNTNNPVVQIDEELPRKGGTYKGTNSKTRLKVQFARFTAEAEASVTLTETVDAQQIQSLEDSTSEQELVIELQNTDTNSVASLETEPPRDVPQLQEEPHHNLAVQLEPTKETRVEPSPEIEAPVEPQEPEPTTEEVDDPPSHSPSPTQARNAHARKKKKQKKKKHKR